VSASVRQFRVQRYAWLGVAYLLIVSALHWSRGGPPVQDPGTGSAGGAAGDLLAFYGAWYAIGLGLLGLGWWRAARRIDAAGGRVRTAGHTTTSGGVRDAVAV
jgi:hypothetical protein